MARIETWFDQDLKKPVKVRYIDGNVFSQDNNGNVIGVNVYDNGEAAALAGTVAASIIRADGATVAETGTMSGNKVSVVLPQAAYAIPGVLSIVLKVTSGSDVTTVCAVVGNVYMSSTDSIVDPGTIIPSIDTLIAEINAAVASIPADYSSLWTSLAPAFSTSTAYTVGQYVTYNGGLYRFYVAHPAGTWNNAHVVRVPIGNDVADLRSALKSELVEYNDSLWVQGGVSIDIGTNLESATRIRSGFIQTNYILIQPTPGHKYAIYAYTSPSLSDYVGAWQLDSYDKVVDHMWHEDDLFIPAINANGYSLRIVVGKTDNTSITPDEISTAIKLHISAYDAIGIDDYLRNTYVDLQSTDDLKSGPFIKNGITFINSGSNYVSGDLPDEFPKNVQFTLVSIHTIDEYVNQYIYANSYPFIWFRVINRSDKTVARSWGRFNHTVKNSPTNKWYVLGDSISAGYYSITDAEAEEQGVTISYRPEGLSGVGSVWDETLAHNYWGYANEWFLHRTLVGCAFPGQGYLRVASNQKNGILEVKNRDFGDAGLIVVAWGFNDWHYNMQRGDHTLIDPSVPYPTSGYDTSQLTTVNHAIWYCLGELIRKAPQAKIVVQTPMNGWLYGGDFASNWGIGYAMSQSGKLSDIHDDIVYWANYYGLQIMDMTYNNSVVNRLNIKYSLIDGSHPTDRAHMQLGRTVGTKLLYG